VVRKVLPLFGLPEDHAERSAPHCGTAPPYGHEQPPQKITPITATHWPVNVGRGLTNHENMANVSGKRFVPPANPRHKVGVGGVQKRKQAGGTISGPFRNPCHLERAGAAFEMISRGRATFCCTLSG
jgi:hypothetical protein